MSFLILDAGALVAVDRDDRAMIARLRAAQLHGIDMSTNAMVVAQVWRDRHGRQVNLARLLRAVDVRSVSPHDGRAAGVLQAIAGTTDAVDAAVVLLADPGDRILTSDPADLSRLAEAAGNRPIIVTCLDAGFREAEVGRGRAAYVPALLPRLPLDRAFARVRLPLHLNWSQPDREFNLADRRQRARVYEIVLREGTADDITQYIDGALLVDLWSDLVLPVALRSEWQPLVAAAVGEAVA